MSSLHHVHQCVQHSLSRRQESGKSCGHSGRGSGCGCGSDDNDSSASHASKSGAGAVAAARPPFAKTSTITGPAATGAGPATAARTATCTSAVWIRAGEKLAASMMRTFGICTLALLFSMIGMSSRNVQVWRSESYLKIWAYKGAITIQLVCERKAQTLAYCGPRTERR